MYKFWKCLAVGALSLAASAALQSPAQADGYVRGYAPVQPAFSWSGIYVGGGAGYAWGRSVEDMTVGGTFIQRATPDLDGGIWGGHVGFNYQRGALVLGAEAQWLSGIDGSALGPAFAPPSTLLIRGTVDVESVALLKAKLGYAFGRWLPYVTAGYATSEIKSRFQDFNFTGLVPLVSDKERHGGWVLGAGIDHALTPNWILGVEYLHIDFDNGIHIGTNAFGANPGIRSHRVDAEMDLVMARLSYKFGPREEYRPLK
jgi:outer membrane immunogenic protein